MKIPTEQNENRYKYRLSKNQKCEIAQNLIDILQSDATITRETKRFIVDWIRTDFTEKRKAFYDVWDIVLKNFLPKYTPILFRSCERRGKDGKIASFTGRLECARRFANGKGSLIICDTKENLLFEEEFYKVGTYKNTFYPLADVAKKASDKGGWNFSESLLETMRKEDEYIMRINLNRMHCFKWNNKE